MCFLDIYLKWFLNFLLFTLAGYVPWLFRGDCQWQWYIGEIIIYSLAFTYCVASNIWDQASINCCSIQKLALLHEMFVVAVIALAREFLFGSCGQVMYLYFFVSHLHASIRQESHVCGNVKDFCQVNRPVYILALGSVQRPMDWGDSRGFKTHCVIHKTNGSATNHKMK